MRNDSRTRIMTNIALGIGVLMGGGFAIYQVSYFFPVPGLKFVFMAPFLGMMLYVILMRIRIRRGMLLVGGVFAGVMSFINLFMGVAILSSTLIGQLMTLPFKDTEQQAVAASIGFAATTGFVTVTIGTLFIGGIYEGVTALHLAIILVASLILGIGGTYLGRKIMVFIRMGLREN